MEFKKAKLMLYKATQTFSSIKNRAPDAKVIFCHIPKTGGSSLKILMRKMADQKGWKMKEDYRLHGDPDKNYTALDTDADIVYGHLGIDAYANTYPGSVFMAMLRDPVERAISQYKYQKEHLWKQNKLNVEVQNGLGIHDYMKHPLLTNSMTSMLGNFSTYYSFPFIYEEWDASMAHLNCFFETDIFSEEVKENVSKPYKIEVNRTEALNHLRQEYYTYMKNYMYFVDSKKAYESLYNNFVSKGS